MSSFTHLRGPKDSHQQRSRFKGSGHQRITIADASYIGTDFSDMSLSSEEDIMMVLEDLPSCFLKDYDSGLGLAPPYKVIVSAIESLSDCRELVISRDGETRYDSESLIFYMSTDDLEDIRKSINRVSRHGQTAARSVNHASTYNLLADKLGKAPVPVKFGRHPLRRSLTDYLLRGEDSLTGPEQDLIVDALLKNAGTIAEDKPEKLASLREGI